MKKINYILLLCVIIFSCSSEVDEEVEGGGTSVAGDGWFEGLDLPFGDKTGYPYKSEKMTTATLSINTLNAITANNLLLGANFDGFTSDEEQEIIRFVDPVTVRFPSGVWSNWYDWEKDASEYDPNDTYPIGDIYRETMDAWAIDEVKTGFPGMKTLHDELQFNTVFTYNLNYDTPAKSVARLKDRESKGFDVRYVELGNELYSVNQRSTKIASPITYFFSANPTSIALKAAKPGLRISIPFGINDPNDAAYNLQVGIFNKDYFDAISLHKYVDPEKRNLTVVKTPETYKTMLTSRVEIKKSTEFALSFAPGKKVWLTQWGVSCGLNAASFLGQADAYMYLFENQDIYERAEWAGLTKQDAMYTFSEEFLDGGGRPEKSLRNMMKTGHGAVYEVIRNVFEDSQIYETSISTRILAKGVNAVEAKAVSKDGKTQIFAVNKTVRSVPFRVKIDGTLSTASFKHEALSFNSLQDNKLLGMDESALTLINEGTEIIILPPFSVNKITMQ